MTKTDQVTDQVAPGLEPTPGDAVGHQPVEKPTFTPTSQLIRNEQVTGSSPVVGFRVRAPLRRAGLFSWVRQTNRRTKLVRFSPHQGADLDRLKQSTKNAQSAGRSADWAPRNRAVSGSQPDEVVTHLVEETTFHLAGRDFNTPNRRTNLVRSGAP